MTELEKISKMSELIKVQDEYISFLGNHISEHASFLFIHSIFTEDEDVEKGKEYRGRIEALKTIINTDI